MNSITGRTPLPVVLGGAKPRVRARLRRCPEHGEPEERIVAAAVRSGVWGYGGPVRRRLEERIRCRLGVAHVKALSTGTHALQVAFAGLSLPFGTKIVVPAIAPDVIARAALSRNLVPLRVDVDQNLVLSASGLAQELEGDQDIGGVVSAATHQNTPDYDVVGALCERAGIPHLGYCAPAFLGTAWRGGPRRLAGSPGPIRLANMVDIAITSDETSNPSHGGEPGLLLTDREAVFELASECAERGPGDTPRGLMGCDGFHATELSCALYLAQLSRRREQFDTRASVGKQLDRELSRVVGLHVTPERPQLVSRPQHGYLAQVNLERHAPLTGPSIAWALDKQLPWRVRPLHDPLANWDQLSDPACPPQLKAALGPEPHLKRLPNATRAYERSFVVEQDALLNAVAVELIPEQLATVLSEPHRVHAAWVQAGSPALAF